VTLESLWTELAELAARELPHLPADFQQFEIRQRLLLNDRAREIMARLAEVAGGLEVTYES